MSLLSCAEIEEIAKSVSTELNIQPPKVEFEFGRRMATFKRTSNSLTISLETQIRTYDETFIYNLMYCALARLSKQTYNLKYFAAADYINEFLKEMHRSNEPDKPVRRIKENPQGRYYNLQSIYDKVFSKFRNLFEGRYRHDPPVLCWTSRKTYRTMAHYTFNENKITVSKSLDKPDVPVLVLEFIIFHELLHGVVGPGLSKRGTRYHPHNGEFKKMEALFPQLDKAERLLAQIAKETERQIKARRAETNSR